MIRRAGLRGAVAAAVTLAIGADAYAQSLAEAAEAGSAAGRGFERLAFSAASIGPQSRMNQISRNTSSSMNQL